MPKNQANGVNHQADGYGIQYVLKERGYIKFNATMHGKPAASVILSRASYSGGRRGPAVWVVAVDGKRIDTARGIAMAKFRAKRAVMHLSGVT
jgi:hypothetical protein